MDIGEQVYVTSSKTTKGLIGTIISIDTSRRHSIGVEFDTRVAEGHSCDGEGVQGYCRWLKPSQITTDLPTIKSKRCSGSINKEGAMKKTLKRVTTFIDSLSEPLKTYIRLDWAYVDDEMEIRMTEEGVEAMQSAALQGKSLEEYAKLEYARREKEEKPEAIGLLEKLLGTGRAKKEKAE